MDHKVAGTEIQAGWNQKAEIPEIPVTPPPTHQKKLMHSEVLALNLGFQMLPRKTPGECGSFQCELPGLLARQLGTNLSELQTRDFCAGSVGKHPPGNTGTQV